MRTRQQHQYAYGGISPREFGERTGQSPQQVRELIEVGWFGWTADGLPECLDVASPKAKQPTYRIHASAVQRYYRERAATGERRGAA